MVCVAIYNDLQEVVGCKREDGASGGLEFLQNCRDLGLEIVYKTPIELEALAIQATEATKPKVITMAQARLALLQSGLLSTINTAIINGTDEAMKIEWEYATEIKREHKSLIALTESLGMTSAQLDDLFLLASEM